VAKNGCLRARENVFDPYFYPSGIEEGAEQVYMYKIKKGAKITMAKNIFGCP
jgi:hypothetical protein